MTKPVCLLSLCSVLLSGCNEQPKTPEPAAASPVIAPPPIAGSPSGARPSLAQARAGFRTSLSAPNEGREPAPEPPGDVFRKVLYPSPVGQLTAYVSPDPGDGKKHAAIVWITGGDCNSIGEVWEEASRDNDQTASAYREAGIVMMFPSLRGGNDNPGAKEGFYGEVDDVLAAAAYLAQQPFVDSGRIYLGGHSTGGTLVLLVAAASPPGTFRAVFSFGPADDVRGYQMQFVPFDRSDEREMTLRSPGFWMHSVGAPMFVFEGTEQGNVESLYAMGANPIDPKVHLHPVTGADHFSVLAPVNELIAQKILRDTGATTNVQFTQQELDQLFR